MRIRVELENEGGVMRAVELSVGYLDDVHLGEAVRHIGELAGRDINYIAAVAVAHESLSVPEFLESLKRMNSRRIDTLCQAVQKLSTKTD